ncbi:MAG TPA: hypothetical protein VFV65_02315 [Gemmatimonadales bacterium]|nr:hypothetical protein [Gemmatimonadales bacterium]
MLHFALLLSLAGPAPATLTPPPDPASGSEVIRMMQAKHAGTWYHTVTFTQATKHPDGSEETWYEALRIPGQLRIDIAPLSARNMMLFRNDSIYRYVGGELKASRPLVHPLLVLGFDVYGQPPEKTIAALSGLGYDMAKVHAGSWQGRPVWIVGAAAGDSTTRQFWIDQERLVFVRSLGPHPQKADVMTEIQFNKYVKLGKGWIETEVLFFEGGAITLREEYRDLKADPAPPLSEALFAPGAYAPPGWITE